MKTPGRRSTAGRAKLRDAGRLCALARDPKDEPYVDLAAATRARYLVTRDKDLLDLMDDAAFRQQFPGLTVIDPATLLRELAMEEPNHQ